MPIKTEAAGGQPAARKPHAGRALSSAAHYNMLETGHFLCDALPNRRRPC